MAVTQKPSRWTNRHRVLLILIVALGAYGAWYRWGMPDPRQAAQQVSPTRPVIEEPTIDLAEDGTALGYWCDIMQEMDPNMDTVVAIIETHDLGFVLRRYYRGGSAGEVSLVAEVDGRIFLNETITEYIETSDGHVTIHTTRGDGTSESTVVEDADLRHLVGQRRHVWERYEINRDSGHLYFRDEYGLIGTARPLPDQPRPSDCFR